MADTVEKQVKTKISFDGEADYKKAVADINSNLKTLNSEMKLVTAEYKANGASVETLKAKQETLQKVYAEQKAKVEATEKALERCRKETGENSDASKKLEQQLNYQKAALVGTEGELKKTATELDNVEKEADGAGKELKKSGDAATDGANKFEAAGNALKATGAAIAAATAAIAAAAVAAGKAIWDMANDVASAGDEIDKESQKLQISSNLYQELSYACERSGASIDDLKKGVKNITDELGKAQNGTAGAGEKFEKLGVSLKDANGNLKSTETVLMESIDALAAMDDETARNAAANEIFGKSAAELLPLLNSGSDGIKELMQEADAYGMVMSEDAVKASAAFEDSLTRLQGTFTGLKNSIVSELLPSLTTLMDGFSDMLAGKDGAAEKVKEGVKGVVGGVTDMLPQLVSMLSTIVQAIADVAPDIIAALAEGIINELPALAESALQIIERLTAALLKMLPQLLQAGVQIILQLAQGIAQALPQLVPAIVEVVLELVDTLIDNIPLLIDAALQLVTGLAEGIIAAIPVIIEKLPELITSIVNALVEGIPLLIEGAIQLFMALVQAIPVIIEALTAALPQIIEAIVNGLINGLPMIIEGSIQLFMALLEAIPVIVEALINALPQIVQAIATGLAAVLPELAAWGANMLNGFVTIFSNVLNSVIQWGGNMLTQAVTSITAFVNGIINTAKDIPTKLYNAIIGAVAQVQQWGQRVLETAKNGMNMVKNGILNVFSNIGESFKTVGSNIVNGIWNGISAGWDWLKEKVSNIASSLLDAAKDALGIASPSKKFRDEVGVFMAQGIGVGFENEMQSVSKQIANAIPTDFDVTPHVTTGISAAEYVSENGQQTTLLSRGVTVIQNIYANTTDYAKQQREAEKNFRMIARTV